MSAVKKTVAVLAAVMAAVAFASCKQEPQREIKVPEPEYEPTPMVDIKDKEENQTYGKESKEEIKALASAALEKLGAKFESSSEPTIESVYSQYEAANRAIGWIINTSFIATDEEDTYKAFGMTYERVLPDCQYGKKAGESQDNEKLIYNKETLEAYLATLIHPDEASDYMVDLEDGFEIPRIIEASNGALYALPYYYEPEGYGKEDKYNLTKNNDGSYTFVVTYTVLGDEGEEDREYTRNFRYANVDGRWVFERFVVIKQ